MQNNNYSDGAKMDAVPQSQVDQKLEELECSLERLGKVTEQLGEKLQPVMVGDYPNEKPDLDKECEELSPIASAMEVRITQLDHLNMRLNNLCDRTRL